jgi:hypothetical protein
MLVGAIWLSRHTGNKVPPRPTAVAGDPVATQSTLQSGVEFLTPREEMVEKLVSNGLPVSPKLHLKSQQQMKDKSAEDLVADMGNLWQSAALDFSGVDFQTSMINSHEALMPKNLLLVRIIEHGRKDPIRLGELLKADLKRRIEGFPADYVAYKEEASRLPPGSRGFAISENGDIIGNKSFARFSANCYAILAAMWVLVNVDCADGIDAIASFGMLLDDPARLKYANRDLVVDNFSVEMPIYAVKTLLDRHPDAKYAAEKALLDSALKDLVISKEITTTGSESLYPLGNPGPMLVGADPAAEPRLQVNVPNAEVLSPPNEGLKGAWYADEKTKIKLLADLWKISQQRQAKSK